MGTKTDETSYDAEEMAQRRDEALRRALNMPPRPRGDKQDWPSGKPAELTLPGVRHRAKGGGR